MVRLRLTKNRLLARDLETERFNLRHLGPISAIRTTAHWRRDPEILAALYHSSKPRSLLKWIRTGPSPDNLERFAWAIIPKGETTAIGIHTVRLEDYRTAKLMGALSDRQWWGRDVVVDVRTRLINHFFANAEIDRIEGFTSSINAASVFNYRRLGFSHCGTRHRVKQDHEGGRVYDLINFELFREQWQKSSLYEHTP